MLLLTAGTILGALWADKAWGRFWAWDPKEVWALISLLVYLLMLHTRHAGWSRNFGMAFTAVFGFTAILFTWYGVNFMMGSGMHSYGSVRGRNFGGRRRRVRRVDISRCRRCPVFDRRTSIVKETFHATFYDLFVPI